jgi:hypothetical protein
MGSKFINKHKRKGALASLLLLLRSRAKYFVILLLMVGTATPFIATRENISTLMQFAPVASFLKFTGLSNVFLNVGSDGSYSAKDLKVAFARDRAYDKGSSFWTKLLNKMSSNTPGNQSSIAMLRGTDILKDGDGSNGKGGRNGKGSGKGESAEGANGGRASHNIDAENLVPDVAGMMEKNGMLGDIMGSNLADRHGGGAGYGGASPYMNKNLMAMNGGVDDKYVGKYDDTIDEAGKYIPVVGKAKKARKMGKASGFAWKNAGYKGQKNKMNTRINSNKRAMFQLAETYAMTGSAVTSDSSAPEYQSSYVGSTYDGNDINADLLDTNDGGSTEVPDTGFTGDLLTGIGDLQEVAQECMDAAANEEIDETAAEIDRISDTLGSPPKCCKRGAVRRWNSKLDSLTVLCHEFNAGVEVIAEKCQNPSGGEKMDCGQWSSMKISPCSKWKCFLAFFLLLLGIFTLGIIGVFLMAAIIGVVKFDLSNLGGKLDSMMSFVASGGDMGNSEAAGEE